MQDFGTTLAERAGGRQRIMALARYENRDTLENRIFLDLMVRSIAAARDNLAMNQRRGGRGRSHRTARIQKFGRYRQECRRIQVELAELAEQGVLRQTEAVQPNYVQLYDQRFRQVRKAREQIIRRQRQDRSHVQYFALPKNLSPARLAAGILQWPVG